MRNKITALIIDTQKNEHDYSNVSMKNTAEWFEKDFEIKVLSDSKNILSEINKFKGIDSIITIGEDVNCGPLNELSFEFRKKWSHLDYFDEEKIVNVIISTFY